MGLHNHNHRQEDSDNNLGLELVLGLSLNTVSPEEETITTTTSSTIITPSPSSNKTIIHDYDDDDDDDKTSLTLGLFSENHVLDLSAQSNSPQSVVSCFSSGRVVMTMKRERDLISSEEVEAMEIITDRVSSRIISEEEEEEEEGTITAMKRKKLRLTKDQSALLEQSFKQHTTLNPKQKQALARQLNLQPRQVEVWFQNRRARTKLKQTEVDCEFLKKCCETLRDENNRLMKELQEIKSLKLSHKPLYMPMSAATLTMCPSCERLSNINGGSSNKSTFTTMAPKSHNHNFYNPFINPSSAC